MRLLPSPRVVAAGHRQPTPQRVADSAAHCLPPRCRTPLPAVAASSARIATLSSQPPPPMLRAAAVLARRICRHGRRTPPLVPPNAATAGVVAARSLPSTHATVAHPPYAVVHRCSDSVVLLLLLQPSPASPHTARLVVTKYIQSLIFYQPLLCGTKTCRFLPSLVLLTGISLFGLTIPI